MKLHEALILMAMALLGLFPGAVLSSEVTVQGRLLVFDQTEMTIGNFEKFVRATGTVTKAELDGGSLVYTSGWEKKAGWTSLTPYGQAAYPNEPGCKRYIR